jgi:CheY-like chemotaxis protein
MPRSYDRHKPAPRKKILLASEVPSSCQYIKSNLERVGHKVVTTSQMAAVLERAKAEQVDLIVVDPYAPTQSAKIGCEVVKAIRADPSLAHLPVILLWPPQADSRYMPWNWCDLAKDACTYISKPFNPVELWALVDDPQPGGPHRTGRFVYRPGDWPEVEQPQRRPWWRRWSRSSA